MKLWNVPVAMVHVQFSDRIDGKLTAHTLHLLAGRILFLLEPFESLWLFFLYRLNFLSLLFLTEYCSLLMVKMHPAIESRPLWKGTTLRCTFSKYLLHLQQVNFDRFWKIVKKYCSFCQQEVFHECQSSTDNRAWIHAVPRIFTTLYIIIISP